MAEKFTIRGSVMQLAAITEKRMQLIVDGKINVSNEVNTTRWRKGIEAQCAHLIKKIEAFEEKGDPKEDLQAILNKIGDITVLMVVALQILQTKVMSH